MSRAWDGRLGRTAIAVVVAVVVMVAGIALYFILEHGSGSSSPPLHDDGPTFYAALAEVNSSVVNVTGGPWALFSVYGIAAEEPFSAGVIAYPLNNITTNSCGAAFNGITLWNGSMPVFNGTFNSGSAPFWQFGYFSGTSQEFLLATSVDGRGHVYPPIPYPSSCQPWYDFPNTPTNPESISAWTSLLDPLPPNSPFGAQRVAQVLQTEGVSLDGRFAEIMTLGPGSLHWVRGRWRWVGRLLRLVRPPRDPRMAAAGSGRSEQQRIGVQRGESDSQLCRRRVRARRPRRPVCRGVRQPLDPPRKGR